MHVCEGTKFAYECMGERHACLLDGGGEREGVGGGGRRGGGEGETDMHNDFYRMGCLARAACFIARESKCYHHTLYLFFQVFNI